MDPWEIIPDMQLQSIKVCDLTLRVYLSKGFYYLKEVVILFSSLWTESQMGHVVHMTQWKEKDESHFQLDGHHHFNVDD